jgi:hypothetical protein
MSGAGDTSQPSDRLAFDAMIQGGRGGGPSIVNAVANCSLRMSELTSGLLGMPDGSSYGQAAALMQLRWASGRAAA